jgi:hypothetical protein
MKLMIFAEMIFYDIRVLWANASDLRTNATSISTVNSIYIRYSTRMVKIFISMIILPTNDLMESLSLLF